MPGTGVKSRANVMKRVYMKAQDFNSGMG